MKKLIAIIMVMCMVLSFAACGGNETDKNETVPNETVEGENTSTEVEEVQAPSMSIEEIATALGLTGEEDVMYDLIGAVAGKQYDGDVELYQFEEDSDAYKELIEGKTYLTASAYKKGIVLIFALGVEVDTNLVDAFNALEF